MIPFPQSNDMVFKEKNNIKQLLRWMKSSHAGLDAVKFWADA